jgi:AraC-like DNA-binding protein
VPREAAVAPLPRGLAWVIVGVVEEFGGHVHVAHRPLRVGVAARNPWPIRRITEAHSTSEAEAALSETYSALTVREPNTDRRLRMRLESVALPQLVISDLELSTASLYAGNHHPWFALCLPSQGEVRVTSHGSAGVIAGCYGAIMPPDDFVTASFRSDYGRVKIVMVERSGLEDELAAMLGRGLDRPLRFDLQIDLATSGAAVRRSLSILRSELADPEGPLAAPQIAARLSRVLMASLLVSCRHNYSEELAESADDSRRPRAIRVALAAIEDDPIGLHTVSQIAKVSGLSVRALEEGFQRHVGVSPMRHLRRTRLARAHAGLLAADVEKTTATAVAHAWGFLNYGRFAAEYRKRYGRSPSETLKYGELGEIVGGASSTRP